MMTHDQQAEALIKMRDASVKFYHAACATGNHPFIEFTGLMNEYIKACERAFDQGIDFSDCNTHTGTHLPIESFMIEYINEKLECIFTGRVMMKRAKKATVADLDDLLGAS
jgi:hypothetical protein